MAYVLGIDEVGRGAWAGPLVVGAVILGDYLLDGLTDSKLLTKELRTKYAKLIYQNSVSATLGWVSAQEIDGLGLTGATTLAIKRAIHGLKHDVRIVIDGNINYLDDHKNSRALIKADLSIPAVSAASVIAKVARDEHMAKLSLDFPGYGFEKHVGYGTKNHHESLKKYGRCEQHRVSFKPVSVFA